MKTFEQCCDEVAKGEEWLPNSFYKSVAELYAKEVAIEAVKLARATTPSERGFNMAYTEQEILEKLKL